MARQIKPVLIGDARIASVSGVLVSRNHIYSIRPPTRKASKRLKSFGKHALFGSPRAAAFRERLESLGHGDARSETLPDCTVVYVPSLGTRVTFRFTTTDIEAPTLAARATIRDLLLGDFLAL